MEAFALAREVSSVPLPQVLPPAASAHALGTPHGTPRAAVSAVSGSLRVPALLAVGAAVVFGTHRAPAVRAAAVQARRLGPSASTELLEKRREGEEGIAVDVKPWQFLSGIAKDLDAARAWFVQRAEERGVAWRFSVEKMQAQQEELESNYQELFDESVPYPAYYRLPFHGYDEGNLSWRAAHELEAATQSMCLGRSVERRRGQQFRGTARESIQQFWGGANDSQPTTLLDVGCSGGFSSQEMSKIFSSAQVTGLDLSPYFLSVARQSFPHIHFVHANAEETGLPEASYDVALRLLRPGGVLAILDVDPRRLAALPPFRRWAFQVTEPWCKEGEYFSLDLPAELQSMGFEELEERADLGRGQTCQRSNDPVNSLTLARKRAE
eukprot:g23339.t1